MVVRMCCSERKKLNEHMCVPFETDRETGAFQIDFYIYDV